MFQASTGSLTIGGDAIVLMGDYYLQCSMVCSDTNVRPLQESLAICGVAQMLDRNLVFDLFDGCAVALNRSGGTCLHEDVKPCREGVAFVL